MSEEIKKTPEFVESVTTNTSAAVEPGFFGKIGRAIYNNPWKTAAASVAAVGTGALAYMKLATGGDLDDVVESVETTANMFRGLMS